MRIKLVLFALIACNQQVYDEIYMAITQEAIKSNITREALMIRYNSVATLRSLCNGQKSSWETQSDTNKKVGGKKID